MSRRYQLWTTNLILTAGSCMTQLGCIAIFNSDLLACQTESLPELSAIREQINRQAAGWETRKIRVAEYPWWKELPDYNSPENAISDGNTMRRVFEITIAPSGNFVSEEFRWYKGVESRSRVAFNGQFSVRVKLDSHGGLAHQPKYHNGVMSGIDRILVQDEHSFTGLINSPDAKVTGRVLVDQIQCVRVMVELPNEIAARFDLDPKLDYLPRSISIAGKQRLYYNFQEFDRVLFPSRISEAGDLGGVVTQIKSISTNPIPESQLEDWIQQIVMLAQSFDQPRKTTASEIELARQWQIKETQTAYICAFCLAVVVGLTALLLLNARRRRKRLRNRP